MFVCVEVDGTKGGEGVLYGLEEVRNLTSQHLETKFNTCNHPRLLCIRLSHTKGDSPTPKSVHKLGEEGLDLG